MFRLLRVRPLFRRLWLASMLSLVGDWLSFVAVSMLALDRGGGGALALATVFAVHALPAALATPIAGVVADRFDRRKILTLAPLVQGSLTVLMALFAARRDLAAVQLLLLTRSTITAFVLPAETAALRRTVETEELTKATAVVSATWSLSYVFGMALGGAIAVLGPTPAILIDALSFFTAASLLRGLPSMRPKGHSAAQGRAEGQSAEGQSAEGQTTDGRTTEGQSSGGRTTEGQSSGGRTAEEQNAEGQSPGASLGALVRSVPGDLLAALRVAIGRPALFRAVFSKAPVGIAGGVGWVVLNLVAGRTAAFGTAALTLGVLQAVRGIGTGLGPLAASWFASRGNAGRFAPHVAAATAFLGIGLFPVAESVPVLLLVLALVWGMGSGGNWVLASASLQRLAPDSHVGRLAAVDELGATVSMVGGALLGAVVLESGAAPVVAAMVGVALGAAAWSWLWLRGEPRKEAEIAPSSRVA